VTVSAAARRGEAGALRLANLGTPPAWLVWPRIRCRAAAARCSWSVARPASVTLAHCDFRACKRTLGGVEW